MAYIVRNATGQHWLRSTVWTSEIDRAQRFNTREDANEGIAKAARFNPKGAKNAVVIEEN